ncbi:MAG: hypothetical protein AcusKO_00880 [Acuticoccus sp.]
MTWPHSTKTNAPASDDGLAAECVRPFDSCFGADLVPPDPRVTARLAASILGCPTAQLTCVYPSDPVFRFARSTSLTASTFANAIILGGRREIVGDATRDTRFADLLQVRLFPKARFLAGFPLLSPAGAILGALTLADYIPRPEPECASLRQVEHLAQLIALRLGRL